MRTKALAAAAVIVVFSPAALADIIWDESVHGDISGDRLNPTAVSLALGVNTLIANSLSGDREYIRMTIPAGLSLGSIVSVTWESEDPIGFIAVQQGPVFTEENTNPNVANLLGWTHFGVATVGLNILPDIGMGPGSIGFAPPLPADIYTFWIQQTGPLLATYRLDFVVVPAPANLALGFLGGLALARRRRGASLSPRPAV